MGDDEEIQAIIARRMKDKERAQLSEATGEAAKGGGLSGALLGGAQAVMSGTRSIPKLLGKSALAGLAGAGLTGGATYLGSQLMGVPGESDHGGYTNRAALGGALAGGALGAGVGGLLGAGKLAKFAKFGPMAAKIAEDAKAGGGLTNNILVDQIKKLGRSGAGRTAAALGVGGAGAGALYGANEGTAVDYLRSLKDDEDDVHGPF